MNAKTQDKLDTVVLRDTCEDSTATVNGRQEYHGKDRAKLHVIVSRI